MPPLSNSKHERFAQELVKGNSATKAYVAAGYGESRSAAARLSTNVNIKARVAELNGRAADNVVVSREWVIERLVDNAVAARSSGDFGPSNQALNLLGKELGMFIDRSENVNINHVVSGDLPTEDQWAEEHAREH